MDGPYVAALGGELNNEVRAAEEQLGRADGKAGLVAGAAGTAGAGGWVVLDHVHLSGWPLVAAWLAVVALVASSGLAGWVVRPALGTRSGRVYGVVLYASLPVERIGAAVEESHTPEALRQRLHDVARAAMAKHRRVRLAVDLAFVGLALAVVAAAGSAVAG